MICAFPCFPRGTVTLFSRHMSRINHNGTSFISHLCTTKWPEPAPKSRLPHLVDVHHQFYVNACLLLLFPLNETACFQFHICTMPMSAHVYRVLKKNWSVLEENKQSSSSENENKRNYHLRS